MVTVTATKKEQRAFSVFSFLRKTAPNANINTLKQISSYIAKTISDDLCFDADISCNKYCFGKKGVYYIFSLLDGRKIVFSDESSKFDFWVFKHNDVTRMSMSISVYERVPGDLSTTSVYAEVGVEDAGKYILTFRPKDLSDETLKYGSISYYSKDEIDWVYTIVDSDNLKNEFDLEAKKKGIYPFAEKSYFDLSYDNEIFLDNLDGYVSNAMARVDLLLSNMETLRLNAMSRKKKK